MDKFVQNTSGGSCTDKSIVMDYHDGNTVTGLWNYAQHYAMNDNSYSDGFGPSTPGALEVTAANTYGAICGPSSAAINASPCTATPGATPASPQSSTATGTVYGDADPNYDICSSTQDHASAASTVQMGGQNIGDLLNKAGLTCRHAGS